MARLHGSLVELDGVGVLLLGPSGCGKSECALELVRRGYRRVADDGVEVRVNANGEPVGRAHESLGHHIEIRGLGILSVPDLFGHAAVLASCRIDLACRLVRDAPEYDRTGLERPPFELGDGASVPCVTLPAHPAGTLATLVEVGARDQELRRGGLNAAARFDAGIRRAMDERR
jgi:HPr kinase/phosphorylase